MHVLRPFNAPFRGWVVIVKESKNPTSKVVEEIECSSREAAWETYYQVRRELGTGL
jgi:hypothetical protein